MPTAERILEMWEEELKKEIMQETEKFETEPIQKKSRLQSPPSVSISDFDKIPLIHLSNSIRNRPGKFFYWLPSMSWIVWHRNFTPLLKFKGSGSKVDIKYALTFEFPALCLWFLYLEVPDPVKEFAVWALATIYNATSKDIDKFVTNQMSVDDLVKTGLQSKYGEVLSQVSISLAVLSYCHRKGDEFAKDVTFGCGVLNCLLELVDKNDSFYAVFALFNIAKVDKGMRDGLCFHLELEDAKYLSPFLAAIKYILQAGDKENNSGNKLENKYAKYIADNIGWSVFREVPCFEEGGAYFSYESHRLRREYAGED